jgi:hypothetical protein
MIEHALVLDIETALDRDAAERARRTGPTAFLRSWLHRVVAVTTLAFTMDRATLGFEGFALESALATDPADEPALLAFVEKHLAHLGDDGLLITFNGRAHDVPMLLRRRLHHWMFAPSPLTRFARDAGEHHEDIMQMLSDTGAQRWPALIDICAALGIPSDHKLRVRKSAHVDPFLAKGQTDVLATYVLYCVCAAENCGTPDLLARGWTALADHLLLNFANLPHLTQFATAPMALMARERAQAG